MAGGGGWLLAGGGGRSERRRRMSAGRSGRQRASEGEAGVVRGELSKLAARVKRERSREDEDETGRRVLG